MVDVFIIYHHPITMLLLLTLNRYFPNQYRNSKNRFKVNNKDRIIMIVLLVAINEDTLWTSLLIVCFINELLNVSSHIPVEKKYFYTKKRSKSKDCHWPLYFTNTYSKNLNWTTDIEIRVRFITFLKKICGASTDYTGIVKTACM